MKTITHKIILRSVLISDRRVLEHWDKQAHVINADPNDDWNWEVELQRTPEWREQIIAEINGKPLGFIQIIDPALEESHYWGEVPSGLRAIDIWIGEEKDLGKGYGTEMMKQAINRCFNDKMVNAILVDPLESNVKVHKFYERLGFKFIRKQRFGEDDCCVYQLSRTDWETRPYN